MQTEVTGYFSIPCYTIPTQIREWATILVLEIIKTFPGSQKYEICSVDCDSQLAKSRTKSLLTHMVYFSVAMGCKSLRLRKPLSGIHITIYFCLCACNCCTSCCDTYRHATDLFLTAAFGLCKREWQR